MPKSRSRPRAKQRRYVPPAPAAKPAPKTSPKWYGPLLLVLMGIGVAVIVLNYMGLFGGQAEQRWLYVGLGFIAVGFIGATRWR